MRECVYECIGGSIVGVAYYNNLLFHLIIIIKRTHTSCTLNKI